MVDVQSLGKDLQRSLQKDRRERIRKTSTKIKQKLKRQDIIGAFEILKHWYRKFTGKALKPCPVDLKKTRETYKELFTKNEFSDVNPYDFHYEGEDVNDNVPSESEIITALFKMRSRKAPGLTRISVDHLKMWYNLAHPKEGEEIDKDAMETWTKIVKIIQRAFRDGETPDAFWYGVLVIIPKDDKGGVRGIGLLEPIHKLISQIINLRMAASINFCSKVHGF